MKLRFVVLCDRNGRETEPELQYWNGERWEPVLCWGYKDHNYDDTADPPEDF